MELMMLVVGGTSQDEAAVFTVEQVEEVCRELEHGRYWPSSWTAEVVALNPKVSPTAGHEADLSGLIDGSVL